MFVSKKWLVVLCFSAICGISLAEDTNWNGLTVPVEFWAGSGSNSAMCVVDFAGTGNDVRYAFGYNWDGTSYSSDMLIALDAASEDFTLVYSTSVYGMRVESITYNGLTLVDSGTYEQDDPCIGFWWDGYTEYTDMTETTIPGEAPDNIFAAAMLGASSRELNDGFADGWSQDFTDTATWGIVNTPEFPTVPEPTTIALLISGAAIVIKKRRK